MKSKKGALWLFVAFFIGFQIGFNVGVNFGDKLLGKTEADNGKEIEE